MTGIINYELVHTVYQEKFENTVNLNYWNTFKILYARKHPLSLK